MSTRDYCNTICSVTTHESRVRRKDEGCLVRLSLNRTPVVCRPPEEGTSTAHRCMIHFDWSSVLGCETIHDRTATLVNDLFGPSDQPACHEMRDVGTHNVSREPYLPPSEPRSYSEKRLIMDTLRSANHRALIDIECELSAEDKTVLNLSKHVSTDYTASL